LTACPWAWRAAANLAALLHVHRSTDIGSPRVTGSTRVSKACKRCGSRVPRGLRPICARIRGKALKEVAYCMVPYSPIQPGVNHADATPRSRYPFCRPVARPPTGDSEYGAGIQSLCAGKKGQDTPATLACGLFILRRG